MNLERVAERLRQEEGRRTTVYRDSRGYWTVGDGICVDARVRGAGLTGAMCDALTRLSLADRAAELGRRIPFWGTLPCRAQDALLDMSFNLGVDGLMGFRRMLKALEAGDYATAGRECRSPRWIAQVGAARVEAIAEDLEGSTTT